MPLSRHKYPVLLNESIHLKKILEIWISSSVNQKRVKEEKSKEERSPKWASHGDTSLKWTEVKGENDWGTSVWRGEDWKGASQPETLKRRGRGRTVGWLMRADAACQAHCFWSFLAPFLLCILPSGFYLNAVTSFIHSFHPGCNYVSVISFCVASDGASSFLEAFPEVWLQLFGFQVSSVPTINQTCASSLPQMTRLFVYGSV